MQENNFEDININEFDEDMAFPEDILPDGDFPDDGFPDDDFSEDDFSTNEDFPSNEEDFPLNEGDFSEQVTPDNSFSEEDDDDELEFVSAGVSEEPVFEEDTDESAERVADSALADEYNNTFTGDEQLENVLQGMAKEVTLTNETIAIDKILLSEFRKLSREETRIGLAASVGQWGVLTPIHVMQLEDNEMYSVLDGVRRIVAAMKNHIDEVPCIVWNFKDKVKGKKMANVLSLMLNRAEGFSIKEQWTMLQILEDVNGALPNLIEYLLGLKSGQAMKLKDVMLCESEYEDIRDKLLDGAIDIEAAYRKLNNMRKKEQRLEKEDKQTAVAGIDEDAPKAEEMLSDAEVDSKLEIGSHGMNSAQQNFEIGEPDMETSEEDVEETELETDDVEELLNRTNEVLFDDKAEKEEVSEETLESNDKTDELRNGSIYQKVGQRHPIAPEVRTGTFIRDGFKCRCCGMGGSEAYLAVLAFHHAIPVFAGGPDTKENGLTLCVNCHILLHTYLQGKLLVDKEAMNDPAEIQKFNNIMRFGNIALEACKRGKVSKQKMQQELEPETKHPRPEAYLSSNTESYKEAQRQDFDSTEDEEDSGTSGFSVKLI